MAVVAADLALEDALDPKPGCDQHLVYPWPRRTRDVFFEEIPKLPPGVSEIFAYPVLDGEELRAYDTETRISAHMMPGA